MLRPDALGSSRLAFLSAAATRLHTSKPESEAGPLASRYAVGSQRNPRRALEGGASPPPPRQPQTSKPARRGRTHLGRQQRYGPLGLPCQSPGPTPLQVPATPPTAPQSARAGWPGERRRCEADADQTHIVGPKVLGGFVVSILLASPSLPGPVLAGSRRFCRHLTLVVCLANIQDASRIPVVPCRVVETLRRAVKKKLHMSPPQY